MKHRSAIEKVSEPAIVQLLPDDRFFQRMADLRELIARRAYELFSESGFTHGHDLEHWLQAESQLLTPAPVEIVESQDAITVKTALPGCAAKDIEIHVEPQRLFISAHQLEESRRRSGTASPRNSVCKGYSAAWICRRRSIPKKSKRRLATASSRLNSRRRSPSRTWPPLRTLQHDLFILEKVSLPGCGHLLQPKHSSGGVLCKPWKWVSGSPSRTYCLPLISHPAPMPRSPMPCLSRASLEQRYMRPMSCPP